MGIRTRSGFAPLQNVRRTICRRKGRSGCAARTEDACEAAQLHPYSAANLPVLRKRKAGIFFRPALRNGDSNPERVCAVAKRPVDGLQAQGPQRLCRKDGRCVRSRAASSLFRCQLTSLTETQGWYFFVLSRPTKYQKIHPVNILLLLVMPGRVCYDTIEITRLECCYERILEVFSGSGRCSGV